MQYAWRYDQDATRDLVMVEIRRNDGEEPFTVLLHHFSECGFKQLFSDLFYSDDWDVGRGANGETSSDIRFLIGLWKELGLEEEEGEPFHPKHINLAMDRYPLVYRRDLESVMAQKYGCGHSEIIDELCPVNPITASSPVVKLAFDMGDSDEVIEQKIKAGFELGKSMIDR